MVWYDSIGFKDKEKMRIPRKYKGYEIYITYAGKDWKNRDVYYGRAILWSKKSVSLNGIPYIDDEIEIHTESTKKSDIWIWLKEEIDKKR